MNGRRVIQFFSVEAAHHSAFGLYVLSPTSITILLGVKSMQGLRSVPFL